MENEWEGLGERQENSAGTTKKEQENQNAEGCRVRTFFMNIRISL